MTLTMARALDDAMSDDPPAFTDRPTRRPFSGPYELAIIEEYKRADDPVAKGPILSREGLFSSDRRELSTQDVTKSRSHRRQRLTRRSAATRLP